MEAFPKETHYRNLMSIARGGGSIRPTLEDLHGSTIREKPKVSFLPSSPCLAPQNYNMHVHLRPQLMKSYGTINTHFGSERKEIRYLL
jgi:hypothetical protein